MLWLGFKHVLGVPGDIEDAQSWQQWLKDWGVWSTVIDPKPFVFFLAVFAVLLSHGLPQRVFRWCKRRLSRTTTTPLEVAVRFYDTLPGDFPAGIRAELTNEGRVGLDDVRVECLLLERWDAKQRDFLPQPAEHFLMDRRHRLTTDTDDRFHVTIVDGTRHIKRSADDTSPIYLDSGGPQWWHLKLRIHASNAESRDEQVYFVCGGGEQTRLFDPPDHQDVTLEPNSTPATGRVLIVVRNSGPLYNFRAECAIVARRNDPNPPQLGSYPLGWFGHDGRSVPIPAGGTESLFIARSDHEHIGGFFMRRLELPMFGSPEPYEWSSWTTEESRRPEYDLEVSVFREGRREPSRKRFTLRTHTMQLDPYTSETQSQ